LPLLILTVEGDVDARLQRCPLPSRLGLHLRDGARARRRATRPRRRWR
jgi:hypothetical protein